MENITVKINRRNLTGLVNKTSFNFGGMFISYAFIAIDFNATKNNTASFYKSVQASQNSWTNYPGVKIWNNGNEAKWTKDEVLDAIDSKIEDVVKEMQNYYPDVNFELIGW